jgi:ribosome maturation factor RimP
MDPFALRSAVRDLVEPTAERMGVDVVAVEFTGGASGQVLRLSIDRPLAEGGVTAQLCAQVSRAVEPLLDASDPVSGSYTLEVSSPGIERPVQRRDDFRRFHGFRIRVRLEAGPPRRRFSGVLVGVRDDDVVVLVDGEEHTFHVDTIERAHLDLTVDEYERLGQGIPPLPSELGEQPHQEASDDHQ